MPVLLAPAIGALGVGAGASSFIASGASLVLGIGFQLISGFLLRPKQPAPSDGQVIIKESTSPRFRSYGRVKVAGVLMNEGVYNGGHGGYLTKVFAMGSGSIDAVEEHWLDDEVVEIGDVQDAGLGINVTTPRWITDGASRVNIYYNLGGDAIVDENFNFLQNFLSPNWHLPEHDGKGIVGAGVSFWQTKEKDFARMFPRGADTLYRQVQRGALVRKIAEDLTFEEPAWSDNAAAVIADYLTHPDGMGLDDSWILNAAQSWRDAIAICDEIKDAYGGDDAGTEARYRISNTYYFDERPADVLSRFLQACDAVLYTTPERGIGIKVGKWEEPTVTIDDDAIIGFTDFGRGRDVLTTANTVRARITNPETDYQEFEVPPVEDEDDVAARGELSIDLQLYPVPSVGQAQRLMMVALKRGMPTWKGTIVCNLRALPAWGERFINVIITELGVSGTFEILGSRLIISEGNIVSGIEIDVASFANYYDTEFSVACSTGPMEWRHSQPVLADLYHIPVTTIDSDGAYYASDPYDLPENDDRQITIYASDGSIQTQINYFDLWDKIFAYAAIDHDPYFGIFATADTEFYAQYRMWPILNGTYILAYMQRNYDNIGPSYWWALLEPGSLDVLGVVWYSGLTAWPYSNGFRVMDPPTPSDPILVQCYPFIGSYQLALGALPSINDFLHGTYAGGAGGPPNHYRDFHHIGSSPFRVKNTMIFPLGTTDPANRDFSSWLFLAPQANNGSQAAGFILPASDGSMNVYFYVNRQYMDWVSANPTSLSSPELRDVIQPSNPFGAMIKIPLGETLGSFTFLDLMNLQLPAGAQYRGAPSGGYIIDNDNWLDQDGGSAIPLLDEYTYITDDASGGSDVYSLQQGVIQRRDGVYWIIFYMVGNSDAYRRNGFDSSYEHPIYERVKIFEYKRSTEVATLIAEITCLLHSAEDVSPDLPLIESYNDNYQIFSLEDDTLYIHGHGFKRPFCIVSQSI